jgi:lysyl-tRNA synthetase, class II
MNQPEFLCTPVKSSLLTSVTYSTDQTLQLEFRSGALYRYFAVPPPVFHALITAKSKGVYFNRSIRNRFRYHRIS